MLFVVKVDVLLNPMAIGLLGSWAVFPSTKFVAHLREQLWFRYRLMKGSAFFSMMYSPVLTYVVDLNEKPRIYMIVG